MTFNVLPICRESGKTLSDMESRKMTMTEYLPIGLLVLFAVDIFLDLHSYPNDAEILNSPQWIRVISYLTLCDTHI